MKLLLPAVRCPQCQRNTPRVARLFTEIVICQQNSTQPDFPTSLGSGEEPDAVVEHGWAFFCHRCRHLFLTERSAFGSDSALCQGTQADVDALRVDVERLYAATATDLLAEFPSLPNTPSSLHLGTSVEEFMWVYRALDPTLRDPNLSDSALRAWIQAGSEAQAGYMGCDHILVTSHRVDDGLTPTPPEPAFQPLGDAVGTGGVPLSQTPEPVRGVGDSVEVAAHARSRWAERVTPVLNLPADSPTIREFLSEAELITEPTEQRPEVAYFRREIAEGSSWVQFVVKWPCTYDAKVITITTGDSFQTAFPDDGRSKQSRERRERSRDVAVGALTGPTVTASDSNGDTYAVRKLGRPGAYVCDCPDYRYRAGRAEISCKHIWAVREAVGDTSDAL